MPIAYAQVVNPGGFAELAAAVRERTEQVAAIANRWAFSSKITIPRRADMPMIDIYTHIFRERFYAEMSKGGGSLGSFAKRFRKIPPLFYGDTAMFGDAAGSRPRWTSSAVVFATDAPLAPIPETIVAVRNLGLPADASERIFSSNAKRLLSL